MMDNGIYIKPWENDPMDKGLIYLKKILMNLIKSKPVDVR